MFYKSKLPSSALKGDFCGLCGRSNGKLVCSDNIIIIANIANDKCIQQFTNSWRAVDMFLHDVACGIYSIRNLVSYIAI